MPLVTKFSPGQTFDRKLQELVYSIDKFFFNSKRKRADQLEQKPKKVSSSSTKRPKSPGSPGVPRSPTVGCSAAFRGKTGWQTVATDADSDRYEDAGDRENRQTRQPKR